MGQVLSANFSEQGHLCGLVQDADPEPHAVTISLQQRAAFIDLESTCTCPYSLQCKHAAAVALYALRYGLVEGGAPPEISPVQGTLFGTADREQAAKLAFPTVAPVPALIPLSPEIVGWLNDLQTAVSGGRAVNPDAKILVFYVIAVRPHASIGEGRARVYPGFG